MKEATSSHLGKIVDTMKNVLTCLSTEQTTEQEETALNSLQSSSPRPQKKAGHHTERPAEKRKKRRIPFVALALLLTFTSLCIISLVKVFSCTESSYNTV